MSDMVNRGDVWVDTRDGSMHIWDGDDWVDRAVDPGEFARIEAERDAAQPPVPTPPRPTSYAGLIGWLGAALVLAGLVVGLIPHTAHDEAFNTYSCSGAFMYATGGGTRSGACDVATHTPALIGGVLLGLGVLVLVIALFAAQQANQRRA